MSFSTTGSVLIPCPLCDTLPYDSPTDLAEHLASDCPGRNAPAASTERRDPVRIGGYPETFAPAQPHPASPEAPAGPANGWHSMPAPRRTANPCSDKQANFIRSLCDRTGAELPDFASLNKRDASALIEKLMARPAAERPDARPVTEPAPEGFHILDGSIYKVQTSKTGNRYAKMLVDGEWDYVGARPLRNLSADTLATLDEAKAYGVETGQCMCCGRTLTNPESIENGIGPICAAKYF